MQPLKPRAKKFIAAYVANGGKAGEAAIEAGHHPNAARTAAWRYLRMPSVVDAILNETLRQFATDVPAARRVLFDLMENSSNDMTRLAAAKALLEHGGLTITNRIEHVLRDERSDSEIAHAFRRYPKSWASRLTAEVERPAVKLLESKYVPLMDKQAELLANLEELARRKRENRFSYYQPYPKQADFTPRVPTNANGCLWPLIRSARPWRAVSSLPRT